MRFLENAVWSAEDVPDGSDRRRQSCSRGRDGKRTARFLQESRAPDLCPRGNDEAIDHGRRVLEDQDIVEPGESIWLGTGWHEIEEPGGEPYPGGAEAEIIFRGRGSRSRLLIDAEQAQRRGLPLVVEVVSPAGRVLASARVDGACRLSCTSPIACPPAPSSAAPRPQISTGSDSAFFDAPRIRSEVGSSAKVAGRSILAQGTHPCGNHYPGASRRAAHGSACDPAGTDSSLETLEVSLADSAGNVVFRGGNACLRHPESARLSTSSRSTWVSNCRTAPLVGSAPRTPMPTG